MRVKPNLKHNLLTYYNKENKMQVIEISCTDGFKKKHNCGMMLTKRERAIVEDALKE